MTIDIDQQWKTTVCRLHAGYQFYAINKRTQKCI